VNSPRLAVFPKPILGPLLSIEGLSENLAPPLHRFFFVVLGPQPFWSGLSNYRLRCNDVDRIGRTLDLNTILTFKKVQQSLRIARVEYSGNSTLGELRGL